MQRMHVNSSLPRSGSELMQCLLAQHPQIYASATSPLLEYWYGAQTNIELAEVKSQPEKLMKESFTNFCRMGSFGYYGTITDKPVIIDKSRGWLQYGELLWEAFPKAKMISMVRNIDSILESLDKIYLANPGHPDTRSLPIVREQRFSAWMKSGSKPLGLALDRLNLRQSKGPDDRIRYIEYDDLVNDPIGVMRYVFEFIEIEPIDIDPNNVIKQVYEDDRHYGIFGNHKIRKIISKL